MNDARSSVAPLLPHHRLIAFQVAKQLLLAVRDAHIRDAKLRDEALRSSKSACLNIAEGAGRVTRGDKARSFAIARAEAVEAAAAVEIAALLGDCAEGVALEIARIADRLIALRSKHALQSERECQHRLRLPSVHHAYRCREVNR